MCMNYNGFIININNNTLNFSKNSYPALYMLFSAPLPFHSILCFLPATQVGVLTNKDTCGIEQEHVLQIIINNKFIFQITSK